MKKGITAIIVRGPWKLIVNQRLERAYACGAIGEASCTLSIDRPDTKAAKLIRIPVCTL